MEFIPEATRRALEHKGYRVFAHAGVEICPWTKKSLRGKGDCYKAKFYGVKTHSCAQVSPALLWCHHRCIYCWRPTEYMLKEPPEWLPPSEIIPKLVELRRQLLIGIRGAEDVVEEKIPEGLESFPKHWAISLSGEPTLYPYLPEMVRELAHRGAESIFVVTNGQEPEMVRRLTTTPLSQLYVSVNAPDEENYRRIARPLRGSFENQVRSLKAARGLRRVVRITLIKGYNDGIRASAWAEFLSETSPEFVEVKAYAWFGSSRFRLTRENVPTMEEVRAYAKAIAEASGYLLEDEDEASQVVLLKRPGVDRWLFPR